MEKNGYINEINSQLLIKLFIINIIKLILFN